MRSHRKGIWRKRGSAPGGQIFPVSSLNLLLQNGGDRLFLASLRSHQVSNNYRLANFQSSDRIRRSFFFSRTGEPMKECKPEELIEVFDRILVYIFGNRYARDNPHATDMATAKLWAEQGCDAVIAAIVLYDRMSAMHERHLHTVDKTDRTNVPGTLKLFTDNIEAALRRESDAEVDECEKWYSQWRSRLTSWKKKGLWLTEMWGPKPDQDGCRAPKSLISEFSGLCYTAHRAPPITGAS
jgi:hypothetical protein